MPHFSFKACDSSGRIEDGRIEAASREAALEAIARRGRFALELAPDTAGDAAPPVSPAAVPWWNRQLSAGRTLPLAAQAMLARELATLLKADLPLDEVLRLIALQPRIGRPARQLALAALDRIMAGAALSDALALGGGTGGGGSGGGAVVPQQFWRLVRAGETGGTLPQVLDELAAFLEQSARLRGQVVTAMLYPAILLAAALAAVLVVVLLLVPAVVPLFQEARVAPPLLITALLTVQRALTASVPLTLAAAAVSAGLLAWCAGSARGRTLRGRLALRLPGIGGLVRRADTARFARTLATLTRNGVPMLEALQVTGGTLRNHVFRSAVAEAGAAVNRGGTLLAPLARSGLFPDLALRLVALGEQTGQLSAMLTRVADIYEHDVQQQLQRLLAGLVPAVTLLIGVFVGALVLSVMGAMLALNDTVLQ
jgi:general secretion pathway protein F